MLASVAHAARTDSAAADIGRSTASVGHGHKLSKRAELVVVALLDKLSDMKRGTPLALALRHGF